MTEQDRSRLAKLFSKYREENIPIVFDDVAELARAIAEEFGFGDDFLRECGIDDGPQQGEG